MTARGVTRVVFPHAYSGSNRPYQLSQETLQTFANGVVLPAYRDAVQEHTGHVAPSYQAEMVRIQGSNTGGFRPGTVDVPSFRLPAFARRVLLYCEAIPEFRDAFFLHEFRGLKGRAPHSPQNRAERKGAMNLALQEVDPALMRPEEWMVDVGLEVRDLRGRVMCWTDKGHQALIAAVLGVSREQASNLTRSEDFQVDMIAQTGTLAGFHTTVPRSLSRATGAVYMQAYSTEKTIHYNADRRLRTSYQRRNCGSLLPSALRKTVKSLGPILEVLTACMGESEYQLSEEDEDEDEEEEEVIVGRDGRPQEASARVEVRVPITRAEDVLLDLPYQVIHDATVSYLPIEFWYVPGVIVMNCELIPI